MQTPSLHTPHGTLIQLNINDAQLMVDYYVRNRDHLTPWEPQRNAQFYQPKFWQDEIARRVEGFNKGNALHLVAIADGQVIACCNFSKIDASQRHGCFLGYSLDHQHQGKGKMYTFVATALNHLFRTHHVPRVTAGYMPINKRSGALLERLGFKQIGVAEGYLQINGSKEDHIITVKTNPLQHHHW